MAIIGFNSKLQGALAQDPLPLGLPAQDSIFQGHLPQGSLPQGSLPQGSLPQGSGALFDDVYIIDGQRTPFGKLNGRLSSVSPTDLGIFASRAAIEKSGVDAKDIDQTLVANIGQASADSFFLPRHISLYAGAPEGSTALLAQRICGSGIEILAQAAEQIALNKAELILACGTDTMSRFPLASYTCRQGFALGRPDFIDLLWEALNDTAAVPMGQTADNIASQYHLSRDLVDQFAYISQQRYADANSAGFYDGERCAIPAKGVFEIAGLKPRKYRLNGRDAVNCESFDCDEHPRQTSMEKLASLPYVFSKEGPTTAGTASGIVDGAASVLIASGDYVRAHGLTPLGKIKGFANVGVKPDVMGIGPVPASKKVLALAGMSIDQMDVIELNEAFASVVLHYMDVLNVSHDIINVNGGAIAMGHPLGATGLAQCYELTHQLRGTAQRRQVEGARTGYSHVYGAPGLSGVTILSR